MVCIRTISSLAPARMQKSLNSCNEPISNMKRNRPPVPFPTVQQTPTTLGGTPGPQRGKQVKDETRKSGNRPVMRWVKGKWTQNNGDKSSERMQYLTGCLPIKMVGPCRFRGVSKRRATPRQNSKTRFLLIFFSSVHSCNHFAFCCFQHESVLQTHEELVCGHPFRGWGWTSLRVPHCPNSRGIGWWQRFLTLPKTSGYVPLSERCRSGIGRADMSSRNGKTCSHRPACKTRRKLSRSTKKHSTRRSQGTVWTKWWRTTRVLTTMKPFTHHAHNVRIVGYTATDAEKAEIRDLIRRQCEGYRREQDRRAQMTKQTRELERLPAWPPNRPDLNLIEVVFGWWSGSATMRMGGHGTRKHSSQGFLRPGMPYHYSRFGNLCVRFVWDWWRSTRSTVTDTHSLRDFVVGSVVLWLMWG